MAAYVSLAPAAFAQAASDNDTPACAAQIIQPLVKTADTMWSAYDIFFEDGFEFQLGGKLPGLCGGKCYTGNAMPQ